MIALVARVVGTTHTMCTWARRGEAFVATLVRLVDEHDLGVDVELEYQLIPTTDREAEHDACQTAEQLGEWQRASSPPVLLSRGNEREPIAPVAARPPLSLDPVRSQRLRDVAQLLACEISDLGDAVLIVREVARACATKVNEAHVSLLAKTAGVTAAENGSARGRVAVLAGEAYDATRALLGGTGRGEAARP